MTRPKVYFETMDFDEVVRYASQYAETDLEKAMLAQMEACDDLASELEKERDLAFELNDAGEDLVSAIRDIISEEDDVLDVIESYERRVNVAYVKNQKG